MDLFDFFFPEQAQASHLRTIANSHRLMAISRPAPGGTSEELLNLRQDVNFLTLVLAALVKRLGETKTLSLDDLQDLLAEIDGLDGVSDSGLEPGVLRGLMGVLKQDRQEAESKSDEFKIETSPCSHRYRR